MKPITEIDEFNEDPKYWERILRSHNLGERRGERKWLSYGHDFDRDDDAQLEKGEGRHIRPHQTLGQIEKDGFSKE